MRLKIGFVTLSFAGATTLGTLLYRTFKRTGDAYGAREASPHDVGERKPPRLTRWTALLRGTMAPVLFHAGSFRFMHTPTTVNPSNAEATHPPRIRRWFLTLPPTILLGLIALTLLLRGDYRVAATLGIVQGLGEFLPISSSAHLIITPWLFGWHQEALIGSLTYDVALHMGTLLALAGFFWRDWLQLLRNALRPQTEDGRLFWLLVIASLPGAAIGFVLSQFAEDFFRDKYLVIAGALAIMGGVLYYADRIAPQRDDLSGITWFKALLIGLAQSFAFIPGVSRSGSTMTMGRALGLKRETAARFSFLMALPITFGAGVLELRHLDVVALQSAPFWLGIGMSFLVGVLAIGFLLRYLRSNSFLPFVVYRIALAAVIVIVYLLHG
jgi:undecaprenyl-diphosphatase